MKVAQVTLVRDDPATSTILAKTYVESVPCWNIEWTPTHVVFYIDTEDKQKLIAYRADRVYEVVTEDNDG